MLHLITETFETMKDSAETSAFEGFTVIDNDACSVAIRSIDPNSSWGHEIQVALENRSPDKTYMFAVETTTVNGVETEICNLILVEYYP